MAEGVVVEGKTVEELQREITCSICQEHYTEPKILPCLHYYCKQCVLRLALRAGTGRPFSCPECRSEATLPEGGVDELKTAFFVSRLKTTVSTMERSTGTVDVKCELCIDSGRKAEAYCQQCSMLICNECLKQHKRIKLFLTHEVTSLEDFKEGKAKPVIVKEPQALTKCTDHGETIILYCFDCDTLICHCCMVKGHSDHKFEFCAKAAPTIKQDLLENLMHLKEQATFLSQKIAEIQNMKEDMDTKRSEMDKNIRRSFEELHDMLAKNEQEMLDKTAGLVQKNKDRLSMQESTVSLASAEIQSIVNYLEQCVRHSTDNEVMTMHTEIKRRIDQVIGQCKSGKMIKLFKNSKDKKIAKLANSIEQVSQPQASPQWPISAAKNAVAANYTAHLKITSKPEVGYVINATMTLTSTANKELVTSICKVNCHLRNVRSGDIVQGSVEREKLGVYSIQCTPTARGRHKLAISINGQQVKGSPFSTFVCCPLSLLTKSVKGWSNIPKDFVGIAVTSNGDIFMSVKSGSIIKIDAAGKWQTVLKQNRYLFRDILVIGGRTIYCVAEDSQLSNRMTVLEYNENGNCLVSKITSQINNTSNRKFMGDQYVCSYSGKGFQVLNKDLECVGPIKHDGRGTFVAAAGDSEGNMYFVDSTNNCIQVYDNEGVNLRCFDNDQYGMRKLDRPQNVYVVGHYVFVLNQYDMAVFTTEGVYVTSIFEISSKSYIRDKIGTMCNYLKYIDMDGYVYLHDTSYSYCSLRRY